MAELDVSASATVPVAPEALWNLLCDTTRLSEWVAGTDVVTRTDGPARLGSSYGELNPIVGPWKAKTSWTVVEFDAPYRQVHRTTDIPLASELFVITEVEGLENASRVTITLRGSSSLGVLGGMFFAALRPQTRRNNERTVASLSTLAALELSDMSTLSSAGHR